MIVYMDLENLLKEKNISKNKLCEACNYLVTLFGGKRLFGIE